MAVSLYLRREPDGLRVVGIDREWPGRSLVDPRVVVRPVRNRYVELDADRQRIFDTYARAMNVKLGESMSPEERFRALSLSEQTTFDAITHALMRSTLTDEAGQPLGKALDLVAGLDRIAGEQGGRSGDQQFRIYVTLQPNAKRRSGPIARVRPEPGECGLSPGVPALVPSGYGRAERAVLNRRRWTDRGHRRRLSGEQDAAIAVQRPSHFVEFGCAIGRQRTAARAALERLRQLVVGSIRRREVRRSA